MNEDLSGFMGIASGMLVGGRVATSKRVASLENAWAARIGANQGISQAVQGFKAGFKEILQGTQKVAQSEARFLGYGKNLKGSLSSDQANVSHLEKGRFPPFKAESRVREFITNREYIFVRVHGPNNQAGSWVMRGSEIKGLTPTQIQQRYSLPEVPAYVSDVFVRAGSRMRVGTAGVQQQWGASGGGIQYELIERIPNSAFRNMR